MFTKLFKAFRKALGLVFSRFVIVALAIILQIAWLWVLLEFVRQNYEEQYHIIRYASYVLEFILALIVINKDEPAEYKLPWLVVILLFPLLGLILFAFFGNNQPGALLRRRYKKTQSAVRDLFPRDEAALVSLEKKDRTARSQAEYLYESTGAIVHGDAETEYFPMGEDMFPVMVCELKKAKKFIFLEYFIIQEGKFFNTILNVLEEKAKEGVEVRVMYDDVGSIGKVPMSYVKKLRKRGLNAQVFRPFRPFVSAIHNNRDHRKILVIDNAVAFTGGINLADEYINELHRFGTWKDNAVMVRGNVAEFTAHFLNMWCLQSKRKEDYAAYIGHVPERPVERNVRNVGGYAAFFSDGPKPFYEEQVGKNVYLNILSCATKYVYITTPYLICDNEILSALRLTARRGVDVRIVTPKIPDKKIVQVITRSNYASLIEAGVKIYEYTPGFIHAKTFVSDDKVATVSTINLDYRSLVHHFECGVWLYDTPSVGKIRRDMEQTFAVSEEISGERAYLNPFQFLVKSILQILTPLL